MDQKTAYLVDGTSYIYRAYHAIKGLSNSKGRPTNASLGFTKMILKLISDKNPQYLAIVFDVKGVTFRHEMYPDYKANRPPMPDDLAMQIPVIKSIVDNFNIMMLEKEGYEADDIIGTLARLYSGKGFRVVMVTGDKDFRQLVTPKSLMWDTMKDVVTDYALLKNTYGFEPVKFIDVMALSGDQSDNIPGIPGVGEKTAVGLIQQFGSLEGVYANIDDIKKKKLKENLLKYQDNAYLSKRLVSIDRFIPLGEPFEKLKIGDPNREQLASIFRDLEFKGLWDQVVSRQISSANYRLCLNMDKLVSIVKEIKDAGLVSVDTETTSKDAWRARLVGISVCCEEGKAYYIPFSHRGLNVPSQMDWSEVCVALKPVLEDKNVRKTGQNIKYDAEVLLRHGINLRGIYFDTMVASYVINPGLRQHNLGHLAQLYLNHKMIDYKDVVGKGKKLCDFSEVDLESAMLYSCEDADITLKLMHVFDEKLKSDKNESLFHELEMKLLPVLMDMELTGIKVDTVFLTEMSVQLGRQLMSIEKQIFDEAGMKFNLNSSQQLGSVLFEKLGLPVQRKTAKTKRYSTDVKVLKKLCAFPGKVPRLALRYRTLSKLKSTYLDSLIKMVNPSTGRVHTSYNQTVTATGRLSSSNPNLQNIPVRSAEGREIRKAFVAETGHNLVSADYSQIELRVMAHYSGDEAFVEAFKHDEDIHARTASEILSDNDQPVTPELRRIAKAINFGIIYGMGARRLSEELGIDQQTAKTYIAAYYSRYHGVLRYREKMIEEARQKGYVSTLFNRRRYLPDINSRNNRIRSEAERMAVNTPIQGTAADLIKKAMINFHHRLAHEGFRTKILLQVHDELVLEAPDEELVDILPIIRDEMEGVYTLSVPLKVDINTGLNWDEAH
jgi:DNA polymerase-1